jgi:hypothetical protein
MKRPSMLAILVFARMILAPPVAAEGLPASPESKNAEALVQRELLQPLAAKERDQSRFSRARLPAQERRVRMLDDQPRKDTAGNAFFTFAVDARHGVYPRTEDDAAHWRPAAITGCVYVERGEVFVTSGDRYRPAAFLLGKNLKPAAEPICQGAPTEVAKTK